MKGNPKFPVLAENWCAHREADWPGLTRVIRFLMESDGGVDASQVNVHIGPKPEAKTPRLHDHD